MNNMLATIVPKSDQLNADDLIGRTLTIKVARVAIAPGTEQPVSIGFEGDNNKPYKPCKSMCRVLVQTWGPDANAYVGRSMTLYRDASVTCGGMAVGGIRISHLSDIGEAMTMALTATKQSRKPFTVRPLTAEAKKPTATEWLDGLQPTLDAAETLEAVEAIRAQPNVQKALAALKNEALTRLIGMLDAAAKRFEAKADEAPFDASTEDPDLDAATSLLKQFQTLGADVEVQKLANQRETKAQMADYKARRPDLFKLVDDGISTLRKGLNDPQGSMG